MGSTRTRMAQSSRNVQLYALVLIVSGALCTVVTKIQYNVRSEGTELCVDPADPSALTTLCPFEKPWFRMLLAKFSMVACLVFFNARNTAMQRGNKEKPMLQMRDCDTPQVTAIHTKPGESEPLLTHTVADAHDETKLSNDTILAISWPAMLDQLQTVIANVGLLWLPSSVYQMARGSVIIFSAFLSVKLIGKTLYAYHYASIVIVGLSVVLVGWASTSPTDTVTVTGDSASHAALGLALVVFAQLLKALQIVVEEEMMVTKGIHPMVLVGWEGLWGLAFYVVFIPVLTLTPAESTAISKVWHEDFYDSVVKIWNSPTQAVLCVITLVIVAVFNAMAYYVTKHVSAVMRSIVETLRTLGVWLIGLFVYYVINWRGINSPGEAWTTASWIELVGFILMVIGTLTYKKVLQIPLPVLYAGEARDHRHAANKSLLP